MRRILLVLTVALVMAAMLVVMVAPAFAIGPPSDNHNVPPQGKNGFLSGITHKGGP